MNKWKYGTEGRTKKMQKPPPEHCVKSKSEREGEGEQEIANKRVSVWKMMRRIFFYQTAVQWKSL